jgi:hypothetical protein
MEYDHLIALLVFNPTFYKSMKDVSRYAKMGPTLITSMGNALYVAKNAVCAQVLMMMNATPAKIVMSSKALNVNCFAIQASIHQKVLLKESYVESVPSHVSYV